MPLDWGPADDDWFDRSDVFDFMEEEGGGNAYGGDALPAWHELTPGKVRVLAKDGFVMVDAHVLSSPSVARVSRKRGKGGGVLDRSAEETNAGGVDWVVFVSVSYYFDVMEYAANTGMPIRMEDDVNEEDGTEGVGGKVGDVEVSTVDVDPAKYVGGGVVALDVATMRIRWQEHLDLTIQRAHGIRPALITAQPTGTCPRCIKPAILVSCPANPVSPYTCSQLQRAFIQFMH